MDNSPLNKRFVAKWGSTTPVKKVVPKKPVKKATPKFNAGAFAAAKKNVFKTPKPTSATEALMKSPTYRAAIKKGFTP